MNRQFSRHHFHALMYWAPLIAYAVIFLTPDVIHLQDLSDWTYQGWLLSDYLRGLTTNGYQLKDYPVPNSMVTIILGLQGMIVPILVAEKLLVVEILSGWGVMIFLMAQKQKYFDLTFAWLAFGLLATASCFWNGYLNFSLGALLWCVFVYMEKQSDERHAPMNPWWITAFSIALFLCHALPYGLFVLYLLTKSPTRRLLYLVPSLFLTGWYIFGRYVLHDNIEQIALENPVAGSGILKLIAYKVYTVLKLGLFHNFLLRDGKSLLESNAAIYWTLAGLSAATFAAIVINIIWASAKAWKKNWQIAWFVGIAPFSLLLPAEIFGLVNPAERVLFLYLVYLCVHWQWHPRLNGIMRNFLIISVLIFFVYNIFSMFRVQILKHDSLDSSNTVDAPSTIFNNTRLPYFSHSLFAHSEKLDRIIRNDKSGYMFPSGLWSLPTINTPPPANRIER